MLDKSFQTILQEDENGELFIEFPPDFIEELGWDENTKLSISVNNRNEIIIRKIE